jgi:maltooligosyltrehalose trehalohydrolase
MCFRLPSVATPEMQVCLLDPGAEETFARSKLDHGERLKPGHGEIWRLHQDLLRLRREEPVFCRVPKRGEIDGAVLGPDAFLLRCFGENRDDRLVLVNLGRDLVLDPAPEPLLAPPPGKRWRAILSTEDPQYGGSGTAPLETEQEGWLLPGRCAVVLKPIDAAEGMIETRIRAAGSAQEAKLRPKCES